jgi:hypothetical protein
MIEFTSATADIQGDYRYKLTRVWNPALPIMTFVLLNPSTADATKLDPTLRRCVGFASREGYGGMVILNLYAFRTPYPKVLRTTIDPVGPENDRALAEATGAVVAGWGSNADPARVVQAMALLPPLRAMGVTKDGHPRHPLYVGAETPLIEWPP